MALIKALQKILTLRCEEAAQLMSDQHDHGLSVSDRWALRLHLWICSACRILRRQLELMQTSARRLAQTTSLTPEQFREARERIASKVNQALDEENA